MIALYLNKHKYVFILYLILPSQTYPYNPRLVKAEMLDFIGMEKGKMLEAMNCI